MEQGGLKRYVEILRERAWLVIVVMLVSLGGAVAYLTLAEKEYEAQADLLIAPVPPDDTLLRSLGLIPESADPALDVETAAQLIDTRAVAAAAANEVGGDLSAEDVLANVDVEPIAESNIVAVTARSPSAEEAKALADAFAEQSVALRTETLHEQVEEALPTLRRELETVPAGESAAELVGDIARLEVLATGTDPTVRFVTEAEEPTSAVSPRPVLTIIAGVVGGALLGMLAAVASRILDPTLRREEQLRELFDVPILARVPREPGSQDRPRRPEQLSLIAREAYRTLRATLAAATPDGEPPGSVLITGPSPSEGKTTTAINLAASLALAGKSVILIEADLRRSGIGPALGVTVDKGMISVLTEQAKLEDALVTTSVFGPSLRLLLADRTTPGVADLLSLPTAQRLLEEAKRYADVVIIDSPPLTDVIDALPFARNVESVLLVTRLGKSRIANLRQLGELLEGAKIRPVGFVVLGGVTRGDPAYYTAEPQRPREPREAEEREAPSSASSATG